jgi:hypothetical protein
MKEHKLVASANDGTATAKVASHMLPQASVGPCHNGLVSEDLKAVDGTAELLALLKSWAISCPHGSWNLALFDVLVVGF